MQDSSLMTEVPKKPSLQSLVIFYLWSQENKEYALTQLGINAKSIGTESYFKALINKLGVLEEISARRLSDIYSGKAKNVGRPPTKALLKFQTLAKACSIPVLKYETKANSIQTYASYQKLISESVRRIEPALSATKTKRNHSIEYLESESIYDRSIDLIEQSKMTVRVLINGGLAGKAPKGWRDRLFSFLKLRNNHVINAVEYHLVILCKKSELLDEILLKNIRTVNQQIMQLGISHRIERRVVLMDDYWFSPDFMIIDNEHLFINWRETLDPHTNSNTTHNGFLISDHHQLIQSYKNFYENVIWPRSKPLVDVINLK